MLLTESNAMIGGQKNRRSCSKTDLAAWAIGDIKPIFDGSICLPFERGLQAIMRTEPS